MNIAESCRFISANLAKALISAGYCPLAEANGYEWFNSLPSLLRGG